MANSLKSNIAFNVIRSSFSILYPMLTFMYVTRVLSVDSLGQVHFVKNLTSYFCLAASLGVSYYGIREGAKIQEKYNFSKLVWEILIINFITTTISLIAFVITTFTVPNLVDYQSLMLLNTVSIILNGLSCEWVLTSKEKYKTLAISSLLIQIICLIGMLIFIKKENDSVPYALLLIISSYAIAFLNWYNILKFKLVEKINVRELNLKRHLKPIFVLFAMLVSVDLFTMVDTTMIGFLKGDYSVGVYSAAIKFPRLINAMIAAVGSALVPRLSYLYEVDRDKFLHYIKIASDFIFMVTIPCAVFLFFMADDIVLFLCGDKYTDSILTVRILSLLTLIIPISVLFNNQIFIPMRLEKYVLQSVVAGAVVNIVANSFFIPFFSYNGAAVASVLSELVVMSICLFHVKYELRITDLLSSYIKRLLLCIPIIMGLVLIRSIMDGGIIRLVVSMLLAGLLFSFINRSTLLFYIRNKKQ